ncbi:MAG: phosphoribosyl-AMP cyclohydrolase [Rhodospirillaceae bacterium]|nr:MAG: phosphoribosyl-AMP cyclohydrolase [Rhodospirillaceae bacterium]
MSGSTPASTPDPAFGRRISIEQVEEGHTLAPRFDEHGLIPVVTTDAESGELLMHGFMNAEALALTIETAEAHYYSRSRKALWHKGATSGLVQHVVEMRIDDDQDAVWLRVRVAGSGASCHVGYRSCFYRAVPLGGRVADAVEHLAYTEDHKTFDPKVVYGDAPNPTKL